MLGIDQTTKKNQRKMIGQHLVGLIRASINTRGPKSVYEKPSQHKYTWTISSLKLELASIRLTWTVQSIKTRPHVQIRTQTIHRKGQRADMCTNMVHQLSKISTRTVHERTSMLICVVSVLICVLMGSPRMSCVLSLRTNVLICVLMDSQRMSCVC